MATGIGWLDPGLDLLPWKVRNVGIAASATTTKRATLTLRWVGHEPSLRHLAPFGAGQKGPWRHS